MIHDLSDHCYKNCLDCFSYQTAVLNVGISNGAMLKNYHSLIKSKELKITGIDINRYYLNHIQKYGFDENADVEPNREKNKSTFTPIALMNR